MTARQAFADLARVPSVATQAWRRLSRHRAGLLAAGVAFYGLLSLFPGIAAFAALAGLWMSPEDILGAADSLRSVVPDDAAGVVLSELEKIVSASSGGLQLAAILGFGVALYSASRAVSSLVDGIIEVQDGTPGGSWLGTLLRRIGLTFLLLCIAALTMASVLVVPVVINVALSTSQSAPVVALLRWPIVAGFVLLGIAAVYRSADADGTRPGHRLRLTTGAILASIVILPASIGFSIYLETVGGYSATFGALGGVVTLLVWLWLSSYIVIAGAAVDAELGEGNPATEPASGLAGSRPPAG